MKKIRFIWYYIFDSSFRHLVDLNAEQKYINEIYNMMREKQEYESRKLFQLYK